MMMRKRKMMIRVKMARVGLRRGLIETCRREHCTKMSSREDAVVFALP